MASLFSSRCISSVFRNNLFQGKVAIVTGGGTGIGKAITEELYYLGCDVIISSRNEERLKQAADEINNFCKDTPNKVTPIKCNIRKEDEVKNLITSTLSIHGKLDYLVNNGGGQFIAPADKISLKGWNAVVETNLTGTFLMCREAYNSWMKFHGGSIVNIAAQVQRGFPMMSHSGAARAAVENLTKSLATEWAENGVRINVLMVGYVYSESAAANYPEDVFSYLKDSLPTQRCGTPEEISAAVTFLLSPAASFITGSAIAIDGGGSNYGQLYYKIPDNMAWFKDVRITFDEEQYMANILIEKCHFVIFPIGNYNNWELIILIQSARISKYLPNELVVTIEIKDHTHPLMLKFVSIDTRDIFFYLLQALMNPDTMLNALTATFASAVSIS